ncbi:hypothetical protein NPIL_355391 [Nephila pilipes]|uniref:Uncharacterized protein n=1 Tax=Nephila pilipes TaxID=299642 RepID=A0A8X6ULH2_NEPPI|nr:hypothetical protein NPIL_355391 [Nephila pilipes]
MTNAGNIRASSERNEEAGTGYSLIKCSSETTLSYFAIDEDIDERFVLLDNETLKSLIPKAGPRLKFKKLSNSFIQTSTNFSSEPISDSTTPLCNTDVTFSNPIVVPTASVDPLTILPNSVSNISDSDVSSVNTNSSKNQCNIVTTIFLQMILNHFYTPIPLSSPLSTSGQKKK